MKTISTFLMILFCTVTILAQNDTGIEDLGKKIASLEKKNHEMKENVWLLSKRLQDQDKLISSRLDTLLQNLENTGEIAFQTNDSLSKTKLKLYRLEKNSAKQNQSVLSFISNNRKHLIIIFSLIIVLNAIIFGYLKYRQKIAYQRLHKEYEMDIESSANKLDIHIEQTMESVNTHLEEVRKTLKNQIEQNKDSISEHFDELKKMHEDDLKGEHSQVIALFDETKNETKKLTVSMQEEFSVMLNTRLKTVEKELEEISKQFASIQKKDKS